MAFAEAALAIDGRSAVSIWEEPETTLLQFEAAADSAVVDVTIFDKDRRVAMFTAAASRSTVRDEITRALLALQPMASRDDKLEGWGSFPSAELRRLVGAQKEHELAMGLLQPWRAIADIPRIHEELVLEIGRRHVLFGVAFEIIAVNEATDDYLIEVATGEDPYAVVSLTWAGEPAADSSVRLFRSWRQWRTECMLPDHERLERGD